MTEETTQAATEAEVSTPTETPVEEPPKVSLSQAVEESVKATPRKAAEAKETLSQQLTPEQLKEVDKLLESHTTKAINEALEAREKKFAQERANLYTKEEVNAQMDERINLERQVQAAQRKFDETLTSLGAPLGSDNYGKVESFVAAKLEAGTLDPRALADPDLVKALVIAAGVTQDTPAAPDPMPGYGTHGRATEITRADGVAPTDMRSMMEAAMDKALG